MQLDKRQNAFDTVAFAAGLDYFPPAPLSPKVSETLAPHVTLSEVAKSSEKLRIGSNAAFASAFFSSAIRTKWLFDSLNEKANNTVFGHDYLKIAGTIPGIFMPGYWIGQTVRRDKNFTFVPLINNSELFNSLTGQNQHFCIELLRLGDDLNISYLKKRNITQRVPSTTMGLDQLGVVVTDPGYQAAAVAAELQDTPFTVLPEFGPKTDVVNWYLVDTQKIRLPDPLKTGSVKERLARIHSFAWDFVNTMETLFAPVADPLHSFCAAGKNAGLKFSRPDEHNAFIISEEPSVNPDYKLGLHAHIRPVYSQKPSFVSWLHH